MKVLIVSATEIEISFLLDKLRKDFIETDKHVFQKSNIIIECLITGVGPVLMTYKLTCFERLSEYNLVINLGLAGTYDPSIQLASLVRVVKDRFVDIGAETPIGFQELAEINLQDPNEMPFVNGWLEQPKSNHFEHLPQVIGLTRAATTARKQSLNFFKSKYPAAIIESMEGAAFFLVCTSQEIPCIQIRAISNIVGDRDKSNWNFNESLENLGSELIKFVKNQLNP